MRAIHFGLDVFTDSFWIISAQFQVQIRQSKVLFCSGSEFQTSEDVNLGLENLSGRQSRTAEPPS